MGTAGCVCGVIATSLFEIDQGAVVIAVGSPLLATALHRRRQGNDAAVASGEGASTIRALRDGLKS